MPFITPGDKSIESSRAREAYQRGVDYSGTAQSKLGKYNQDVVFNGVKNGVTGNNNPKLRGGTVQAMVKGQQLDIPNAIAQQLQFQESWNQGRYNPGEAFKAEMIQQGEQEGRGYSDMGATRDLLARNFSGTTFMDEGVLGSVNKRIENIKSLDARVQQLTQNTPLKETRDTSGRVIGPDRYADRVKELEAYNRAKSNYGTDRTTNQRLGGYEYGNEVNRLSRLFDKSVLGPTTSNVPIRERLV